MVSMQARRGLQRSAMRGSITKRADGTYLIRLSIGYREHADGTRTRKYKTETFHGTLRDAEKRRRELVRRYETGGALNEDTTALGDYLREWMELAKPNAKPNTAETYDWAIGKIDEAIGDLPLCRVSPMDIQRFYVELDRKTKSAVPICDTILNQALKQAVRWRRIPNNPVNDVEKPERAEEDEDEDDGVVQAMSPGDFRTFLAGSRRAKHGLLFRIASHSGARPGENLGFTWPDVDWERGGVSVKRQMIKERGLPARFGRPKTRSSKRFISLPEHIMQELRAHYRAYAETRLAKGNDWNPRKLVFCGPKGEFLCLSTVRRAFRKLLVQLGIPDIRLYGLRHTHATELLRTGTPMKVVSVRLGHASMAETADTYSHVDVEMDGSAAEVFGRAYPQ